MKIQKFTGTIEETVEFDMQVRRIKQWLKNFDIEEYTINSDLTVDVDGLVLFRNSGIEEIPFQFNEVKGDFDCSYNRLKNLVGTPNIVHGNFICKKNGLDSLEGGPTKVYGNYDCSQNNLKSLIHCATTIGKIFRCSYNLLDSLECGPAHVNNDYICSSNQIKSLEHSPISVSGSFECANNPLTSLASRLEKVGEQYIATQTKLITLADFVTDVKDEFIFSGTYFPFLDKYYEKWPNDKNLCEMIIPSKELKELQEKLAFPQRLNEQLADSNIKTKKIKL